MVQAINKVHVVNDRQNIKIETNRRQHVASESERACDPIQRVAVNPSFNLNFFVPL